MVLNKLHKRKCSKNCINAIIDRILEKITYYYVENKNALIETLHKSDKEISKYSIEK